MHSVQKIAAEIIAEVLLDGLFVKKNIERAFNKFLISAINHRKLTEIKKFEVYDVRLTKHQEDSFRGTAKIKSVDDASLCWDINWDVDEFELVCTVFDDRKLDDIKFCSVSIMTSGINMYLIWCSHEEHTENR